MERISINDEGKFSSADILVLQENNDSAPVLPDLFMGGSTLCLDELSLDGIPFPGVGNLFCPLITLSVSSFVEFLIPNTFHPTP